LREKSTVDPACRAAQQSYDRENAASKSSGADIPRIPADLGGSKPSTGSLDVRGELEENLRLVKAAMRAVAESDASKLAPLSKRHSELVAELAVLDDSTAREDPFDAFLSGGNVVGISTAASRKQA
jgi:hypothetical protein